MAYAGRGVQIGGQEIELPRLKPYYLVSNGLRFIFSRPIPLQLSRIYILPVGPLIVISAAKRSKFHELA